MTRKKEILAQKAYKLIKEKIISLEFAPGQDLDEKKLMKELDLGRTPIREAILKLETENLVNFIPGKGAFVKQITLKEVKDLLETLFFIERIAAQLAVMNITPEQILEIKSVNNQINEAIINLDPINITYYNSQFHLLIAKASNNEYIYNFIRKIREEEKRLAYLCFSEEVLTTHSLKDHFQLVRQQHAKIITFLEKRNVQKLDEEIINHNRLFRQRIFRFLELKLLGKHVIDLFSQGGREISIG
jgi:DNA-binding GntR family transcriptional regulator